jgi:hypothetical protein
MSRSVLTIIVFFLLVVLASSSHTVGGQEKGVAPPAPVPTQIFTAKNVFISNGGLDGIALQPSASWVMSINRMTPSTPQ